MTEIVHEEAPAAIAALRGLGWRPPHVPDTSDERATHVQRTTHAVNAIIEIGRRLVVASDAMTGNLPPDDAVRVLPTDEEGRYVRGSRPDVEAGLVVLALIGKLRDHLAVLDSIGNG